MDGCIDGWKGQEYPFRGKISSLVDWKLYNYVKSKNKIKFKKMKTIKVYMKETLPAGWHGTEKSKRFGMFRAQTSRFVWWRRMFSKMTENEIEMLKETRTWKAFQTSLRNVVLVSNKKNTKDFK